MAENPPFDRKEIAENVGKKLKVQRLRQFPGADKVMVALNSELTYHERKEAEWWTDQILGEANAMLAEREKRRDG